MELVLQDQQFVSILLVLLCALVVWDFDSWVSEWKGLGLGKVAAIAFAALLMRLFLISPAIIHGDWQGAMIVQGVLEFPEPSGVGGGTYGANYGQGSFVVLALLSKVLGQTPAGVLRSNVVVSVLATFPLAFVAARWGGSQLAGILAAGLWASSGLVGRTAHSEDAHLVGLFFGLIALAYAERTRSQAGLALLGLLLSGLLAAWSRETCYAFAPIALLLMAENLHRQRFPAVSKRRTFFLWLGWAVACVVVGALLLRRVSRSYQATNLYGWLIEDMLKDPMLSLGLIIDHPFFSFRRLSPLVGLFGLAGVFLLGWRNKRFSIIAGFILYGALTLPAGNPYVGMSWSFRLPVYTLGIICAGGALAVAFRELKHLGEGRVAWLSRPAAEGVFVVLALVGGLFCTATWENMQKNAEFVEFEYFWKMAAKLPPDSVLITDYLEHRFLIEAVARSRRFQTVRIQDLPERPPSGNWFLPVGQGAWSYTLVEVAQILEVENAEFSRGGEMPAAARPLIISIFDRRLGYGATFYRKRPSGLRREFEELISRSELVEKGPQLLVHDTIPHAIFSQHELSVALYRWVR